MTQARSSPVDLDHAVRQLIAQLRPGARVTRIERFAPDGAAPEAGAETTKAAGYGQPVHISIAGANGLDEELVLHTATPDGFGHDRRADRVAELVLAFDTFADVPSHVRALDVGVIDADGGLRSLGVGGEPYLLSTYARGRVYAEDLRRIARDGRASKPDRRNVVALARYLAGLHRARFDAPVVYMRALRDLVGGGEGVFGLVDSYPDGTPGAPPESLHAIEEACMRWRWRLRGKCHRLCRVHGDFHPWNIVLGEHDQPTLLDASRGCRGDAADDVAAMAVNFPLFALDAGPNGKQVLADLLMMFVATYLEASADDEVLTVIAPFLAWRCLVVVSPVFYPGVLARDRERVLAFATKVLASDRFEPSMAASLFA
jgi:hypothetical protein